MAGLKMADLSYTPKEVSTMLGLVDTYLRWRTGVRDLSKRSYISYHPSEWGRCLRQQQYKHYVAMKYIDVKPNEQESRITRLFDHGHNMHHRWTNYFREMGILRGNWKCKNQGCYLFDDNGQFKRDFKDNQIADILAKNETRIYGEKEKHGVFRPEKCLCGCTDFDYVEASVIDKDLNIFGHCDVLLD